MIFLFVFIVGIVQWTGDVYAESCGTLACRFEGSTAVIVLTPDPILPETVKPNHGLRWLVRRGQNIFTVQNSSSTTMIDLTLWIREFGPKNEGTYYVDCVGKDSTNTNPKVYVSEKLNVTVKDFPSETHPTTTTNTRTVTVKTRATTTKANHKVPLGQSANGNKDDVNTSIAIVVASLCVVIIVIVISGTILVIRRNKNKSTEDNEALANIVESSMTSRMAGDGESIYNEIDTEYESSRTIQGASMSPEGIKPLTLPRRPDNKNKIENNYSEVSKNGGVRDRSSSLVQNVYTEVGNLEKPEKPQQPTASSSKDYMKMYATVVPKKHRINKDETLDIQYLYSKPVKNRNDTDTLNDEPLNGDKYNVEFPKIDVNALNTKMGTVDRSKLVSMTEENFDAAVCRAGVYRSQKRKSSRRNELTYVELDHSGKNTGMILRPHGSNDPREKMEYVAIDFEKKAFIAPPRKAPSSWYKRKNKKKKN